MNSGQGYRLADRARYSSQTSTSALPKSADIVIIGGGIIGTLAAVYLANRIPGSSMCIIERDLSYTYASTVLSAGSLRVQYSIPENIYMSVESFKFLKDIGTHLQVEGDDPPDIQLIEKGFLFLAPEKMVPLITTYKGIHEKLGIPTEILQPSEIKERYPWLNLDDIVLGSYGCDYEAMFDPWAYLMCAKKKAQSMGVRYIEAEVKGMERNGNRIDNVSVVTTQGERATINCGSVINAAGAWSSGVAKLAGIGAEGAPPDLKTPLPVEPFARYGYVFECRDGPVDTPAVVVDGVTGVAFRRETSGLFAASAIQASRKFYYLMRSGKDKDSSKLEVDYDFFDEGVWPGLATRCDAFNGLKLVSAWAGYYEINTLDNNAIIGPHPAIPNFYFSTGYSGHGLQHSPAAGRAISELILDGKFTTMDLSKFSFDRIIRNEPYKELAMI
ncbi:uncharacterized protein TRIADDRAFT_50587 [Trichoplax adhaerens]|uniref:FAD-dependent oxidoreductase domain-containing protein 1 n=1 Tax=Trichoplax adhaerens TaxID=10228 RepID=B3S2T5_TRIAD|nr:hypothetical protein TRIADDRAFT_50587 [Trichoplax adhaerens]EDV22676.1 hypothetical protein TRIADDRAFT_50587 [Trichoplax adhaerens]|eukprot:XP_002114542.1 hypothetical protein TRIADDRAFT_50587 [Trichoplax adhaerens]